MTTATWQSSSPAGCHSRPRRPRRARPARPQKYTAYLINLEKQLPVLLPTEPVPAFTFDATISFASAEFMTVAPNATIDQTAMMLGPGRTVSGLLEKGAGAGLGAGQQARLAPYGTSTGIESAAASWAPGPARSALQSSDDVLVAGGYKAGVNQRFHPAVPAAPLSRAGVLGLHVYRLRVASSG